jgi:hypothetical protein
MTANDQNPQKLVQLLQMFCFNLAPGKDQLDSQLYKAILEDYFMIGKKFQSLVEEKKLSSDTLRNLARIARFLAICKSKQKTLDKTIKG